MIGYYMRLVVILIVCVDLTAGDSMADFPFLGCKPTSYLFPVSKNKTINGQELYCYDDVFVLSCKGRCDSYEVGHFDLPYKKSHHPVCMYQKIEQRVVRLRHCHPDHPDPYYEVFDATECGCSFCNPSYTSCENLNG